MPEEGGGKGFAVVHGGFGGIFADDAVYHYRFFAGGEPAFCAAEGAGCCGGAGGHEEVGEENNYEGEDTLVVVSELCGGLGGTGEGRLRLGTTIASRVDHRHRGGGEDRRRGSRRLRLRGLRRSRRILGGGIIRGVCRNNFEYVSPVERRWERTKIASDTR